MKLGEGDLSKAAQAANIEYTMLSIYRLQIHSRINEVDPYPNSKMPLMLQLRWAAGIGVFSFHLLTFSWVTVHFILGLGPTSFYSRTELTQTGVEQINVCVHIHKFTTNTELTIWSPFFFQAM